MADDTLTVEQAKQRLLDLTPAALWEDWLPALDALIAAVRAEREPDAHTKRVMAEVDAAIDDEFS
jgi:hypothetical protein